MRKDDVLVVGQELANSKGLDIFEKMDDHHPLVLRTWFSLHQQLF